MLNKIDFQILELLVKNKEGITSKDISFSLSKSSKTIQNRIPFINEELKSFGASILVKKGFGYELKIDDENLFNMIWLHEETHEDDVLDKLIQKLIETDDYIKADDLVERLYISKSTLTKALNQLRGILTNYNLEIEVKPHYGMRIHGNEFDYRRFISSNYVQKNLVKESLFKSVEEDNDIYETIRQIVITSFKTCNYSLPEYLTDGLIRHLYITIRRIMKGNTIEFSLESSLVSENEDKLMDMIIAKLEEEFSIKFNDCEQEYVLLQLLSKQEIDQKDSSKVPEEINELVEKILIYLRDTMNFNFLNDFNLRIMLGLHLVPLKFRLEHGIVLKNPIIEEIKLQCISGYDLAIVATHIIEEEWGFEISESEISYFALHFDVALKKEKQQISKKKILLVCGSGRASSQLIHYNFQQYFSQFIDTINICDVNRVEMFLNSTDIDYIFTTVPLRIKTSIPIFEFSFFLNEDSIQKIKSVLTNEIQVKDIVQFFKPELFFTDVEAVSKDEALSIIFKKLRENMELPNDFEELVLEREKFSSTDLLPNVALPHPNKTCTESTFISVTMLKKPIEWNKQKVWIIFLISMSKTSSEKYKFLYEWIIKLLSKNNTVKRLIDNGNYETFVEELMRLN